MSVNQRHTSTDSSDTSHKGRWSWLLKLVISFPKNCRKTSSGQNPSPTTFSCFLQTLPTFLRWEDGMIINVQFYLHGYKQIHNIKPYNFFFFSMYLHNSSNYQYPTVGWLLESMMLVQAIRNLLYPNALGKYFLILVQYIQWFTRS